MYYAEPHTSAIRFALRDDCDRVCQNTYENRFADQLISVRKFPPLRKFPPCYVPIWNKGGIFLKVAKSNFGSAWKQLILEGNILCSDLKPQNFRLRRSFSKVKSYL